MVQRTVQALGRLIAELARQFEAQAPARPVFVVLTIERWCLFDSYLTPALNGSLPQGPATGRDRDLPTCARKFFRSAGMDDRAKGSGGRVDRVSAIADALVRITHDLLGQYTATYNASSTP